MNQKTKTNKILYGSCITCLILLLAGSLVTFHDLQVAQGVGLYLANETGNANRLPFDILADVVCGLCLLLCVLLPPLCFKKSQPDKLLHFMLLFLALIPLIQPGSLVHAGEHLSNWQLNPAYFNSNFFEAIIIRLSEPFKTFIWELPLLILLFMANNRSKTNGIKGFEKLLLSISALCIILYLLFPGFGEYTLWVVHYALVIVLFYEAELLLENNLFKEDKKSTLFVKIFWIFLGLRGIYRMIDLMQNTHL